MRVQAGLVKPAEFPPPYEAPPSYKAAVAMSLHEAPPPSYLLREAVIVYTLHQSISPSTLTPISIALIKIHPVPVLA